MVNGAEGSGKMRGVYGAGNQLSSYNMFPFTVEANL